MTMKENWPKKYAGLKDAITAWLLVLAAIAAMNVVVTLTAPPQCPKRSPAPAFATTSSAPMPGLPEAALRNVMLLAGMADSSFCG
jgi:hypothetical protein